MTPQTTADLSDIMRAAEAPLRIVGGDSRGIAPEAGATLQTTGLAGIKAYQPGALTMVAGAGTSLQEVEDTLAAQGQRLAFEPMRYHKILGGQKSSTIGGVFAANISGSRRIQTGAARDFLLGIECVDGQGQVIRNGGRVMKNVTGYDLVKLLSGSCGTLGVLSEVAFKVLPASETETTFVLEGLDSQQAVKAMTGALATPFDVSGAAYDMMAQKTYIRIEGFLKSVGYRAEKLSEVLGRFGAQISRLPKDASADLWHSVRNLEALADLPGDIWRISVKPSDAPAVCQAAGLQKGFLDWSGGLIWGVLEAGANPRPALQGFGGHATCIRGQKDALPRFQPEAPQLAVLSQKIRQKFDPRGILNTGLMD